jgi:hypothetical protein
MLVSSSVDKGGRPLWDEILLWYNTSSSTSLPTLEAYHNASLAHSLSTNPVPERVLAFSILLLTGVGCGLLPTVSIRMAATAAAPLEVYWGNNRALKTRSKIWV